MAIQLYLIPIFSIVIKNQSMIIDYASETFWCMPCVTFWGLSSYKLTWEVIGYIMWYDYFKVIFYIICTRFFDQIQILL